MNGLDLRQNPYNLIFDFFSQKIRPSHFFLLYDCLSSSKNQKKKQANIYWFKVNNINNRKRFEI